MLIFLIGYMGSGKTSIGKKLAKKFDCSFVDLDDFIERQTQKNISDIFSEKGEKYFRDMESKYLKQLISNNEHSVISTGGGTPCFLGNMGLMNTAGTTVYLKLSPKSLQTRLTSSKNQRPLIANKNNEELITFIQTHLQEREQFYYKSKFTIKGEDLTAQKLYDLISNKSA